MVLPRNLEFEGVRGPGGLEQLDAGPGATFPAPEREAPPGGHAWSRRLGFAEAGSYVPDDAGSCALRE
jgi:hypothetical protein